MKSPKRVSSDTFILLAVIFSIILFDRVTKSFFSHWLYPGESFPLIENILHMTLVHNTGIAFGLFKGQGLIFIIISSIAVLFFVFNIFYSQYKKEALSFWYLLSFSLIIGGAAGNLFDRIVYGYVIDFIDFRIWPVFNVADSAITIGAIIIAIKCFQPSAK
jgi:signal peptidase II